MANHNILAVGASAGGLGALKQLAAGFPSDLPAAVLFVMHLRGDARSALADIIDRAGPLRATFAHDRERLEAGSIYIAPPDRHLLLDDGHLRLGAGPRENNSRPAIDPMFRSAAICCGPRTVGVVLTGYLNDGASGLRAIKRCGGTTVVQDPQDAAYPDMPRNALAQGDADHVVALNEMPALLQKLVRAPARRLIEIPEDIRIEVDAAAGHGDMETLDRLGKRSVLSCPDCHGALWELEDGELIRYRCHIGHAYTAEALDLAQGDDLGRALESALRALEERVRLLRRLQEQAHSQGRDLLAQQWAERAHEFEQQVEVVRRALAGERASSIFRQDGRPTSTSAAK